MALSGGPSKDQRDKLASKILRQPDFGAVVVIVAIFDLPFAEAPGNLSLKIRQFRSCQVHVANLTNPDEDDGGAPRHGSALV
jgi:hypothetical protein